MRSPPTSRIRFAFSFPPFCRSYRKSKRPSNRPPARLRNYYMDALLSLIKEKVLLDDLQIEEVDAEHTRSGKPVSQILLDMGFMDMPTQLSVIADQLGT